jgi:hypothetical protein
MPEAIAMKPASINTYAVIDDDFLRGHVGVDHVPKFAGTFIVEGIAGSTTDGHILCIASFLNPSIDGSSHVPLRV